MEEGLLFLRLASWSKTDITEKLLCFKSPILFVTEQKELENVSRLLGI